jgi:hypothetical protein
MIRMHENRYWLIFLLSLCVCTLGYTLYTSIKLYEYLRLRQELSLKQVQWSVEASKDDHFLIHSHYQFIREGILYQGQTTWDEGYPNRWAAEAVKNRLAAQSWKVWIDPSHPDYSTLQKTFPFKQCLSTIVLWSLLAYFFLLGNYVKKYSLHQ